MIVAPYLFVVALAYLEAGLILAPAVIGVSIFGARLPARTLASAWGWAAAAIVATAYLGQLVAA